MTQRRMVTILGMAFASVLLLLGSFTLVSAQIMRPVRGEITPQKTVSQGGMMTGSSGMKGSMAEHHAAMHGGQDGASATDMMSNPDAASCQNGTSDMGKMMSSPDAASCQDGTGDMSTMMNNSDMASCQNGTNDMSKMMEGVSADQMPCLQGGDASSNQATAQTS